MSRHICHLFFSLFLIVIGQVVLAQEIQQIEPNTAIEREIAGGESQTYQISLTAGQFLRVRAEQKAIDLTLTLTAPDGKQVVEMNLTRAGGLESLSEEALASGYYRL